MSSVESSLNQTLATSTEAQQTPRVGAVVAETPSFAKSLADVVASSTNEHGVRSSKRTAIIHNCISSYMTHRNPDIRCVVEHSLSTMMGDFKVDIAVFIGDVLVACLLFKGLTSSISKNEKNYEHNKLGEAMKAKTGMSKTAKLVYLDVVPIRCPTYKTDDSIGAWESHLPESVRERNDTLRKVANMDRVVPLIDDIYTVSVDYEYMSRSEIAVKTVVDDSDLIRFEAFLTGLVPPEGMSSSA